MHVVDLKQGFVTSWENVIFTLENMGTCVKITWNYFPCVVHHKVIKRFHQLCALRFGAVIIFDFYIDNFTTDNFVFALFIFMKDSKAVNCNGSKIIG